jgi:serralysin
MDELFFDYPEPLTDGGIASNDSNSDYDFTTTPPGIRVFNDSLLDGDSILLLELKPNSAGLFSSGFGQDFYSFKESKAKKERGASSNPFGSNSEEFTYVEPITTVTGSNIRSAVVLIQDNEKEAAGLLRRTILGSGNDNREFLADNKDDTVLSGTGNDEIRTGGGNDILFGEAGNDLLDGGAGNDYLFGNQGNDRLFGREGNDWLDGGLGWDRLEGGNGNDIYVVDSLGDQIIDVAGTGMETVRTSISWILQSGLEHLFLIGGARIGIGNSLDNFIRGNNLGNTLWGRDGDDTLFGDALELRYSNESQNSVQFVYYEDFFRSSLNNPDLSPNLSTIQGYQNLLRLYQTQPPKAGDADTLKGGNGNDKLFGWTGNDTLYGEAGNDWLFGGYGDDMLLGGAGDDRLDGEQGNDTLIMSQGNDVLFGGGGADKFRFNAMPGTFDKATIQDFAPEEDVIEISKSAFGNPTLSQFSFSPLGGNSGNLFLGNRLLVTVNSSSPFSISNNVKLI